MSRVLVTFLIFWIGLIRNNSGLTFRGDQFTDLTEQCKNSDGKPIRYILNEDNPAMYVSVDNFHEKRAQKGRLLENIKHQIKNSEERQFMHEITEGSRQHHWSIENEIQNLASTSDNKKYLRSRNASSAAGNNRIKNNNDRKDNRYFDCRIHFETEKPIGDKTGKRYDALSLFVVEYHPASNAAKHASANVEIVTMGHRGYKKNHIKKVADYSTRLWPGHNPNFLLSGQLSGLDSTDFKTKVDPEHLVQPEKLHSTFDQPAQLSINLAKWYSDSHIYLVVTSYKYLRNGERCQEGKEFDCSSYNFLSANSDHMCMNTNLACDGLPNCGQNYLPNQDENCYKIHWSSVLLSLVSYILLAITLLLCLSCFARVLIQWSVRSSLAELRGSANSPTGSFRSSSRFFSFLGTTITGRWERPPPTYDEALKHVNPDLARPSAPPPYNDFVASTASEVAAAGNGDRRGSAASHGIVETPPPEYQSQENSLNRLHMLEAGDHFPRSSNGRRYQRRHHRHHKNKTVTTADVLTTSASVEALLLSPPTSNHHTRSMEAASSPMMSPASALTLTSVEINDIVNTDNTNASKSVTGIANTTTTTTTTSTFAASGDAQTLCDVDSDLSLQIDMSPSRFSSNSINTVILNPNIVNPTNNNDFNHHHPNESASNTIQQSST